MKCWKVAAPVSPAWWVQTGCELIFWLVPLVLIDYWNLAPDLPDGLVSPAWLASPGAVGKAPSGHPLERETQSETGTWDRFRQTGWGGKKAFFVSWAHIFLIILLYHEYDLYNVLRILYCHNYDHVGINLSLSLSLTHSLWVWHTNSRGVSYYGTTHQGTVILLKSKISLSVVQSDVASHQDP